MLVHLVVSALLLRVSYQVGLDDAIGARDRARQWLLQQWKEPQVGVPETGAWGNSDTVRVVSALQLVDNSWISTDRPRADISLKSIDAEIFKGLSRSRNMSAMTGDEGAEFVHLLMATCRDPRNFFGHNLVQMLRSRLDSIPTTSDLKGVGHLMVASLALCNAGVQVPLNIIKRINSELKPTSSDCVICIEAAALSLLTMKCLQTQYPDEQTVKGIVTRQSAYIQGKQDKDGGFDNVFTTTAVLQAANSVGTVNLPVNVDSALKYILEDQEASGSFGSIPLTAFVMTTLAGKSLLDIRSMSCPGVRPASQLAAGKIGVELVIHDDIYSQRRYVDEIEADQGQTILDLMNKEAAKHPRGFKFATENINGITQVTKINSLSNNKKNKWAWTIWYAKSKSGMSPSGLGQALQQNGDTILLRYTKV